MVKRFAFSSQFQAKAIPATYNGIQFRSRLEARWAIVFDECGVDWVYEPEGYQLESGWYLPDFLLSKTVKHQVRSREDFSKQERVKTVQLFVEVKPCSPSRQERDSCSELSVATDTQTCIVYGQIPKYPFTESNEPIVYVYDDDFPLTISSNWFILASWLVGVQYTDTFGIGAVVKDEVTLVAALKKARNYKFW